ncbi:hypothetical protein PS898_03661 [Pseudomonas fluorescens]|nr:hypothetical protein PS898_03661 [Pseudomonas fluorescens]
MCWMSLVGDGAAKHKISNGRSCGERALSHNALILFGYIFVLGRYEVIELH